MPFSTFRLNSKLHSPSKNSMTPKLKVNEYFDKFVEAKYFKDENSKF